jgi:hypothetical protein
MIIKCLYIKQMLKTLNLENVSFLRSINDFPIHFNHLISVPWGVGGNHIYLLYVCEKRCLSQYLLPSLIAFTELSEP